MADSFWQLKQNFTTGKVKSAQKAVDYLQGDMLYHIEKVLTDAVDQWRKRGFKPMFENPTRILIQRSAKSYKEPPKRSVLLNGEKSDALTESYSELLARTSINFSSQDLDERSRLLQTAIMLPQVADDDDETITLTVLSRDNAAVKLDKNTKKPIGLFYTAFNSGLRGGQMFHFWDNNRIVDIEEDKVVSDIRNPYGIIPMAMLHDTRPPSGDLWAKAPWEQLTALSDGVNLFNTEALFNARYGMVGSPVTNMVIPEGTVTGIDAPLQLSSEGPDTPFFEFRAPTVTLSQFTEWLNVLKETIADEWGVNLKFTGTGSAESGFKLVVEEFENIELREKRIISAKQYEKDLYQVFATMSGVHNWGLDKEAIGFADFKEPALPVDKSQDWLIAKEQIALGVLTIEEYWLIQDPDLTPEQIAERTRKANAARGLAGTVPTFDGGN